MAIGVLMEMCGWEAAQARTRLVSAAAGVGASVEHVAEIVLELGSEHPVR